MNSFKEKQEELGMTEKGLKQDANVHFSIPDSLYYAYLHQELQCVDSVSLCNLGCFLYFANIDSHSMFFTACFDQQLHVLNLSLPIANA